MEVHLSVLDIMARRMFEVWRAKMDRDGEHQHDLHAFEDLTEYERDFAFGHARAAVEALKNMPKELFDNVPYDMYEPDYREQFEVVLDNILAGK